MQDLTDDVISGNNDINSENANSVASQIQEIVGILCVLGEFTFELHEGA